MLTPQLVNMAPPLVFKYGKELTQQPISVIRVCSSVLQDSVQLSPLLLHAAILSDLHYWSEALDSMPVPWHSLHNETKNAHQRLAVQHLTYRSYEDWHAGTHDALANISDAVTFRNLPKRLTIGKMMS